RRPAGRSLGEAQAFGSGRVAPAETGSNTTIAAQGQRHRQSHQGHAQRRTLGRTAGSDAQPGRCPEPAPNQRSTGPEAARVTRSVYSSVIAQKDNYMFKFKGFPQIIYILLLAVATACCEEQPEAVIPQPRLTEYEWMSIDCCQHMHAED